MATVEFVPVTLPSSVPDLHHLQTQIDQLQAQLGSLTTHQSSPSIATLATGTSTAFHAQSVRPTWVLDLGVNDHMNSEFSFLSSPVPLTVDQTICLADGSLSSVSQKGVVSLSPDISLICSSCS